MPRNSSGTYSLPAGNPVVSNTLIQSTWANNTCSDLGSSITDSLDRSGRGAMLAPLKNVDGTAVAPSITFSSEGTLGIYRPSAGVLGIAAGGALILSIASTGLTFTNPLVIPIGSATAPSLTFVSNTNTGIYSPATNQVAITNNGVQRLLVDASGVVTLSSGVLALSSTTNVIEASSGTGALQFQTGGANTRLTIDSAGNFTFATPATFSAAVTFSSTVAFTGALTLPNNVAINWKDTGGTARVGAILNSSNAFAFGDVGNAIATSATTVAANSQVNLSVNNTNIVSVNSNGMGVGAAPIATVRIAMSDGTITTLLGYNYSSNTISGIGTNTAHALGFLTSGAERVRIDTSGNVGIGLTPSAKLHVNGDFQLNTTSQSVFSNNYGTVSSAAALKFLANSNMQWQTTGGTVWMTLDTSGQVGIATAPTSTAKLTVSGAIYTLGAASLPASLGGGLSSFETPVWRMYIGDGTGYSIAFSKRTASTTTDLMTFTDAGNVGIGRTPSGFMLDVAGTLRVSPTNTSGAQVGMNLFDAGGGGGEGLYLQWSCTRVADMARIGSLGTGGTGADLIFYTNNLDSGTPSERMRITSVGVIQDASALELGWKDIPMNSQAGPYTLVVGDRGKCVQCGATGVTVPASVFSQGAVITIYNNSAGSQTITQGASVTLYYGATGGTGNRTLGARGIATVVCLGSNTFVITGAGLT